MTLLLVAHVTDHTSIVEDLSQEQPAREDSQPGLVPKGPSTSQARVQPQCTCCCSSSTEEPLSTSQEAA